MTAPTVAVTAKLSSFGGPALAGVVITATSDKDDNYQGLILRKTVTATTNASGEAVFNLFPNALATAALPGLGTTGSTYRFTASVPNGWRMDVQAQVPNVACDLHSIVMADDAELPTPGEVAGAVRYDIAQTLTSPQQAQARTNIGFDAAVRAVALTGLSLATATAIAATDTALVAFGKAQAQITALDTAKANLSGAAFTGAVSAPGFTGPLTGNVTGNVSGSAGSVAASAITGTTLAANVVTSSLTAVGTIATGVWQGTAIADAYLATISTAGKVANSATTATSANTASAIVARDASGNFTAGTITAALTGNASTATTLQTTRTINGVNFNGSANITVTAAAGTLTGATLAAGVTASSLTSVGTLTALTVSGTSTLGVTRASAADGAITFGVAGTTRGVRIFTSSYGTAIEGVDNTLVGSYQPLNVIATTLGLYTTGGGNVQIGTGSNLTQFSVTHTASAVNFIQATGAATGGVPSLAVGGSDANVWFNYYTKGSGLHQFITGGGVQFAVGHVANAVNRVTAYGNATGLTPGLFAEGSDANVGLGLYSKAAGPVFTAVRGAVSAYFDNPASPVNYATITGSATGLSVVYGAAGTDAAVPVAVTSKGTASVGIYAASGTIPVLFANHTAAAVNYLQINPGATGNAVTISTGGSDTNRSLSLTAAGAGLVQITNDSLRIVTSKTPASATATGAAGQFAWDTSYIYVCTATDTWKRAALSTW